MISLGLSAADQAVFNAGLIRDHKVDTRVTVLDMDQNVVGQVTGGVSSGQVDLDATQDVERSCTVTVRDPENRLGLVAMTPTSPPVTAAFMVRIEYGVRIPALGRWVWVPVFTGPVDTADSDDGIVTITGKGKESLLSQGTSMTTTYRRGWAKTAIIENLLDKNGEKFRRITPWGAKTTSDIVVASTVAPWPVLKGLARSLSGSDSNYPWLGYDGRGYCVLKSHSQSVVWRFDPDQVTDTPHITADMSATRNFVVATPNNPGGKNKLKAATARAPRSHPFSPESLGRGGVPRFMRDEIQGDWVSQKQIQSAANARLAEVLLASVSLDMKTVVVPHLEPRDVVRIVTDRWAYNIQVMKWTIPLGASESMSHGRTMVVRPKKRAKLSGRGVR